MAAKKTVTKKTANPKTVSKKNALPKKNTDTTQTTTTQYDAFKLFAGQQYTGMKVGGHHKWYYHEGEWKETKRTPDLWEFHYNVNKKRAGKAPEGSGVPVGTEYQWGILAFQNVKKLDANTYSTSMSGLKFKVAHKRADKDKWNASINAQRKRFIKFLEIFLEYLKHEEIAAKNLKKQKSLPKLKNANFK